MSKYMVADLLACTLIVYYDCLDLGLTILRILSISVDDMCLVRFDYVFQDGQAMHDKCSGSIMLEM